MDSLETRLARSFGDAAMVYAAHTSVQAQARARLWQMSLRHLPQGPLLWADLGCGDGALAAHLAARWGPGLGLDIAAPMLALARRSASGLFVQASFNALPLRPASMAALFSNFALQWGTAALMPALADVLETDGLLALALPVAGSLQELAEAWAMVGRTAPLRPLPSADDWQQAVRVAGLRLLAVEEADLVSEHASAVVALRSLKASGAGVYERPARAGLLGRIAYQRILHALEDASGRCRLRYRVLWLLARKEEK